MDQTGNASFSTNPNLGNPNSFTNTVIALQTANRYALFRGRR